MYRIHLITLALAIILGSGLVYRAHAAEASKPEPSPADMRQTALSLYSEQATIILSTINEQGYPEARYVMNLRKPGNLEKPMIAPDSLGTLIVTSGSSDKVRQLRANPNASVYMADPATNRAVLLTGTLEEILDETFKEQAWGGAITRFYSGGPKDPSYTLLRFTPKTLKLHGAGTTIALDAQ